MGKLPQGTDCETLDSLAGKLKHLIDFYFWKGIPCFRMWPRFRMDNMSAASLERAAAFGAAVALKSTILPEIKDNFKILAEGSTQTWTDMLMVNAMAYNAAGFGYMPALTAVDIETGSGITSITLQFDHPCNPVLQFYRGLRPYNYTKRYRGRSTRCKRPNQTLDARKFPMSLVFDNMFTIEPTARGQMKYVTLYQYDLRPCPVYLAEKVGVYNAQQEAPWYTWGGAIFQRIWKTGNYFQGNITGFRGDSAFDCTIDSVWCADIDGNCVPRDDLTVGFYGAWQVEYPWCFCNSDNPKLDTYFEVVDYSDLVQWSFAPLLEQNINGVLFLLQGQVGPVNPGGKVTCDLYGIPTFEVDDGNFSDLHIEGIRIPDDNILHERYLHSMYYTMPVFNICHLGYSSQQAFSFVKAFSVSLTLGPRWQYTFTFPRPLKPGIDIYCTTGYDKPGEFFMYPVTVTDTSRNGDGWGELMAEPYEE